MVDKECGSGEGRPCAVYTRSLTKNYSDENALQDVSIKIEKGEAVSLIGANGAGKTTLINLLLGYIRPDRGSCKILGSDSLFLKSETRQKIGLIADHVRPMAWANPNDLRRLFLALYAQWDDGLFESLFKRWKISRDRSLNRLSKGQRRMAEIILVLSCTPSLLIMDEPFNGLDCIMRIQVRETLKEIRAQRGITILYTSHILSEIKDIADRVIILKDGRLFVDETCKGDNTDVLQLFLSGYNLEQAGANDE